MSWSECEDKLFFSYIWSGKRLRDAVSYHFKLFLSRFLRNKRDILLSLQHDNETIMNITKEIRKRIAGFSEDYVFTASDFEIDTQNQSAVVKALNRMVKSGEISKLAKGRFYKPRKTQFGELKPSAYQIAKDYIERDGKLIGYITGYSAYNALGLTTQISSYIQIGTNKSRRSVKREKYTISFILQQNPITKKNIEILRILDAIRFIREIPATTPNEACLRLKEIVRDLNDEQREMLVKCVAKYTNYVRALCGAILEDIGCNDSILESIRKTLNGVTEYKLPISESVLPTKQNWKIYEPTRK